MICYKGKRANKKFLMRRNGKLDRELLGHGLKGYGAYMGGRPIVNIGVQRFDKLRRENRFYIDKTGFIREWWETGSDVTLITRPRRFGKTLNMSMTECFFSNKYADRGDLFEGLDIWSDEKFSNNVRKMNTFMNKVALQTFSSFDSGNHPSEETQPERFYHGFVLGMVVNLADRFKVRSNRESGYGRYDVMIEPLDRTEKAFIFEFKILDADDEEKTLEDTLSNARRQIDEKNYEAELYDCYGRKTNECDKYYEKVIYYFLFLSLVFHFLIQFLTFP